MEILGVSGSLLRGNQHVANFSLPDGWEDALQDQELDFTTLVDRLIELQRKEAV